MLFCKDIQDRDLRRWRVYKFKTLVYGIFLNVFAWYIALFCFA